LTGIFSAKFTRFGKKGDRVHTLCITIQDDSTYFNINTLDVKVLINIGCLRLGK